MKRIIKFILPLFFAVVFLLLPGAECLASSSLPEEDQKAIRAFLTDWDNSRPYDVEGYTNQGNSHCNIYIIYRAPNGDTGVLVTPELDHITLNGTSLTLSIKQAVLDGVNNYAYGYRYYQGGFYRFGVWGTSGGSAADAFIGYCSEILYSNTSLKAGDGTTVFQRAPLKGRLLEIAERELEGKAVPKAVETATMVTIIVASLLLLLKLLPKLVKKSVKLLVR